MIHFFSLSTFYQHTKSINILLTYIDKIYINFYIRAMKNLLDKPKDQFEMVSFVNEPHMTHHRLKLLVKSLWTHFHTLANYLDSSRPDISKAIDSVLEGNEPDIYGVRQRFSYYIWENVVVVHDGMDNSIKFMNKNGSKSPKITQCDENELKMFLN